MKRFVAIAGIAGLLGLIFLLPKLAISSDQEVTHPLLAEIPDKSFVFFGFTECHGACPTTLARLAAFNQSESNEKINVVFLEIDKHGEHQIASDYAKTFDTHFIGIAPNETQLAELSDIFRLNINASFDELKHSGRLFFVERNNNQLFLRKTFNALAFSHSQLQQTISALL